MKQTRYTVEGSGTFPFDMLRYDASWPQNESDSHLIEARGKRTVTLRTHNRYAPTHGRWESFGWRVTDITAGEAL